MEKFEAGQTFEIPYPFVRGTYTDYDGEGAPYEAKTWNPGVNHVFLPPDSTESVYDAMGSVIYTVVSTHKPGRHPERVFYARQWRRPDGGVFGNTRLRTATVQNFRTLLRGYQYIDDCRERTAEEEAA